MSERAIKAAHAHLTARYGGDKRLAFVADPHVQTTAGGRSIVHLQQHYDGIPLFGCDIAVHLDDGEVSQVKGSSVEAAPSGDGTPDLGAIDAVAAAIAHFRAKSDRSACQAPHRSLRGAIPPLSTVASFPFPARPTVFRLGRAEP